MNKKTALRKSRHNRIRARVSGVAARPRLSVYRSNKFIYAQLIDDANGVTLASASDAKSSSGTKMERAAKVGKDIAEAAKAAKVSEVVYDRGGFEYAGRVKQLAEAAREAGLQF